jgi:hypothetical protein
MYAFTPMGYVCIDMFDRVTDSKVAYQGVRARAAINGAPALFD